MAVSYSAYPFVLEIVQTIGARSVRGHVREQRSLLIAERRAIYSLFEQFYLGTDRDQFERDLFDKDWVVLLTNPANEICGFSTMKEYLFRWNGEDILIFYSGDTIIHSRYWGSPELSRVWTRHMFGRIAERAAPRAFWFLISSGYKTYRLLPLFFKRFIPGAEQCVGGELPRILTALANDKFGDRFDERSGIIRLERPTPLRPGIAEITERELRQPDIKFFADRNPGWNRGDELAGLAELRVENLTRGGLRMIGPDLLERLADNSNGSDADDLLSQALQRKSLERHNI